MGRKVRSRETAWFYTQQNYGGTQRSLPYGESLSGPWTSVFFGMAINSVINHTSKDLCGFNDRNHSINYRFGAGGAWNYVGSPFSSSSPMNWAGWSQYYGC
ncbi:hypothetical protein ACIPK5_33590 [Streptomyces sp. NPDC086843]|uniref:hypothetical protein n=1 Tax=Streptomyces sp. NPDC086843 TaxID=3365763 RepID=UPI0037F102FA